MIDYLYDMLESYYAASEDGLIIYRDDMIKYQNEAFIKLTGSRLCITSVREALGPELEYRIRKMLENNRRCGINKFLVAGKVCKIRANKCGEDTAMVIHVIDDFEKKAEEARFALDSIFGISGEQNDAIMTVNVAIDTIGRKISNIEDVSSYLDSTKRACLLSAKHNVTIRELSSSAERNETSCDAYRAINTVKKMCDTLIGRTRLEIDCDAVEACSVKCNIYELENIMYSIVSQLLRENPKPGKLEVATMNEEKSVRITIACDRVIWDKSAGGTDILRAENRIRVCGGKVSIEENKIIVDLPRGEKQLIFKEPMQSTEDMRRALIELCEVI